MLQSTFFSSIFHQPNHVNERNSKVSAFHARTARRYQFICLYVHAWYVHSVEFTFDSGGNLQCYCTDSYCFECVLPEE